MPTPGQRVTLTNATGRLGGHAVRIPFQPSSVAVPGAAVLKGLSALTMECWVLLSSYKPFCSPIFYHTGTLGYFLQMDGSNFLTMQIFNGTTNSFNTDTKAYPLSSWHHIAGVYSGADTRLFLDGAQLGTPTAFTGTTGSPTGSLVFGNSGVGFGSELPGLLAEARLSNSARYSADFLPQTRPFVSDANTIGLWHMSEGTGTTCFDSGPNKLHARFGGIPFPGWSKGPF